MRSPQRDPARTWCDPIAAVAAPAERQVILFKGVDQLSMTELQHANAN
jgi:hypothetical protein